MSLSVKNITVSFPGIVALNGVSLDFRPSRVHAVLGSNGSGKSTLVKVLTGIYQPDARKNAEIKIGENTVREFSSPKESQKLGIRVVHQETPLINTLTVAECVALFKGYPRGFFGKIRWKQLHESVRKLFAFYNIDIEPTMLVRCLSAAERGMVAMAIALGVDQDLRETKALILDEADASIPEADAEKFLNHVRNVADFNIPVIMVTHRLKEVRLISDDVTILNDGAVVYSGIMEDARDDFIISKMLRNEQNGGEDKVSESCYTLAQAWEINERKECESFENTVLEVKNMKAHNIDGLSFALRAGVIIGFVGIPGSGVNELPMILGGDILRESGDLSVRGKALPLRITPKDAIRAGIVLQPADRFQQGGIMSSTLRENMLLPNEDSYWHKKKKEMDIMKLSIELFNIRPPAPQMAFRKFSGGNQQKAIIGKWLLLRPNVLVLDDPTYGVDPAARQKIFATIREASALGTAVIVFSTEPEQLACICSKVFVLRRGKIVQELDEKDHTLSRESIAGWCYA